MAVDAADIVAVAVEILWLKTLRLIFGEVAGIVAGIVAVVPANSSSNLAGVRHFLHFACELWC